MKTLLINAIVNNKKQNLLIDNQFIAYIGNDFPETDKVLDLSGKHIISGMIDPHTHIRDLAQKDKEDWLSATKAAIAGGVTTLFDMPNTKPPTTNLKNLQKKREVAKKALVNYRFNLAATSENIDDLKEILNQKNKDIGGLKLFLAGSNSNEFVNDIDAIKQIFQLSLQYDIPLIIHTEWQECIEKYSHRITNPKAEHHNYLRHRECAIKGTQLVVDLAKQIGNQIVIAHTSLSEEIEIIRKAKAQAQIYCEVSPHHLLLNENVIQKSGNFAKVNPPLRSKKDNEALWNALLDGTVDFIGSDHAPHQKTEKLKSYPLAPSGFPGLETSLPLLLYQVKQGRISMQRLEEIVSKNTAKIFKIEKRGIVKQGYFADLAIFDLTTSATVNIDNFHTKAKYSPFENMPVVPIEMSIIKGKIYKNTKL
jgi:dihydroorotase